MGNAHLTFEAFYTILVQIEAVLNSRPMYHIPSNTKDPLPITPAHFLIGRNLVTIPEPDYTKESPIKLSTFNHLQKIRQHFWKRWSREYIPNLQTISKWRKPSSTLFTPGTVVIVKDDNAPPFQWKLGIITETHPGQDNIVRVVSVKCGARTLKRAITKLCVLPKQEEIRAND